MIPNVSSQLLTFETGQTNPGKTFFIDFKTGRAIGVVDDKESLVQTIKHILNVERYKYTIYSWNYGVELKNLFGEPISYICAELERRITEALMQDDRIKGTDSFTFDTSQKGKVHVSFIVRTIYGEVESEKEVWY